MERRSMEVELKLQVSGGPRQVDALRRAVHTPAAQVTRLQAVYADTAGQRLAAAGFALRLRKEGRRWVQALKGRGDGLLARLEHEVTLPPQRGTPAIDPARHAGTDAGAALARLLAEGDAVLQPLHRTDVRRTHRRLRRHGALVEIAFDEGHIAAGGLQVPVCELEFELVSGRADALPRIAAEWVQRHALWWDVRTKSERGMRLALGIDDVPAVKAGKTKLAVHDSTRDAWRAVLRSALAQVLPNAAEVAAGSGSAAHLHQLRVGLRRLRTALSLCADWSADPPAARALEAEWQPLFAQLGSTRDADVLADGLLPEIRAAGGPAFELPPADQGVDAGATVRSAAFNVALLRTFQLVLSTDGDAGVALGCGAAATAAGAEPEAGAVPAARKGAPKGAIADAKPLAVAAAARQLLQRAWKRAMADAALFADAPLAQQHRARKRLKRLRYALEFLRALFPRKVVRRQLDAICRALDAMGRYNDLRTAQDRLGGWADREPRTGFALGWLAAQRAPVQDEVVRRLARLKKTPRAWAR